MADLVAAVKNGSAEALILKSSMAEALEANDCGLAVVGRRFMELESGIGFPANFNDTGGILQRCTCGWH